MHSVEKFTTLFPEIKVIVVLPQGYISYWKDLCRQFDMQLPHNIVSGGATRADSVRNGLDLIDDDEGVVAVHDAVRPLVSLRLIKNCLAYAEKKGNAVPAISVNDSLRILDNEGNRVIERHKIKIIQTPQCFLLSVIKKAYRNNKISEFTDDASIVEAAGVKINLVDGIRTNIKITDQDDMLIAEALIKSL